MSESNSFNKNITDNILSLTPHNHGSENQFYVELLDEAICNRDDTTNIALSGPYGAGKSTILNSYKKFNSEKNESRKNIVNISMASFSDASKDTDIKIIEKTILQQMIYSVSKDKLPLSKFNRISTINKDVIKNKVIDFFLWILTLILVFNASIIESIFSDFEYINTIYILLLIALSFLTVNLTIQNITNIIYSLKKLNLNKIVFKNVELIFSDESTSVLNHNIDEILYFFEATKSDVVIIEDLDRFKQPDIFINLRELNNQINNSEQVQQNVSFIYAVKEDMFQNEDRVKFFDLIVPVIPFINSENSNEMITGMLKKIGLEQHFSNDFIYSVSIYIHDMRLLTNIINEFLVYFHKLFNNNSNEKFDINYEKLFSIIIYKNFHPEDFTMLHKRQGDLFQLIHKTKDSLLKSTITAIDIKLSKISNKITEANNTYLKNTSELRRYLMLDVAQTNQIHSIQVEGTQYTIVQIIDDEKLFQKVLDIEDNYTLCTMNTHRQQNINIHNIIIKSKNSLNYEARLESILNKSDKNSNNLNDEHLVLTEEKNNLKSNTVGELILNDRSNEFIPKTILTCDLLFYIVSHNYITDDYPSYISLIHDLSEIEINFLRRVKISKETDASITFNNFESIIKKLSIKDFQKNSILNISLVNFIIDNKNEYSDKKDAIFNQLVKLNPETTEFISTFLQTQNSNIDYFIHELSSKRKDLWNSLSAELLSESFNEDNLLLLILKYADKDDIYRMNSLTNGIATYINEMPNFINFACNFVSSKFKIKEIINNIDVRLEHLDMPTNLPEIELLEFVCDNGLYVINKENLKMISSYYNKVDTSYEDAVSYTKLSSLPNSNVIEHINDNIDLYISNAYIPYKHVETNESVKKIIDNHQLNDSHRKVIIEHMDNIFDDIEFVDELSWKYILKYKKIKATWQNVLKIYTMGDNNISDSLKEYLNEEAISNQLKEQSLLKVDGYDTEEGEIFLKDFMNELYFDDNLSNENLKLYRKTSNYCWQSLDLSTFDRETLITIVTSNYLCTESNNYSNLKEHKLNDKQLHMHLIEYDYDSYSKNKDEYELSIEDISFLLNSLKLNNSSKIEIYTSMDIDEINFKINFKFIQYILLQSLIDYDDKIELLINQMEYLERDGAIKLVGMLDEKYKKILTYKQFEVENNNLNLELASMLEEKSFIKDAKPLSGQAAGRLRIRTNNKKIF